MPRPTTDDRPPQGPGALHELAGDPASRKRFLKMAGGAGAATAFAAFLTACGGNDTPRSGARGAGGASKGSPAAGGPAPGGGAPTREKGPDPKEGTSDLEILNYALGLEQLEASFYAKVIESGLFRGSSLAMIERFADDEREHREALEATVSKLGGTPVAERETDFPLDSAAGVLRLGAALENDGAAAYLGQANRIRDKEVLAAALSIHSVEARHAAALNGLLGRPAASQGSFAQPVTMEEVLTKVQRFIA